MVCLQGAGVDVLQEDIDVGRRKLSSADLLVEEHVEFGERATGGFGDTEVGIDDTEEANSTLETSMSYFHVA